MPNPCAKTTNPSSRSSSSNASFTYSSIVQLRGEQESDFLANLAVWVVMVVFVKIVFRYGRTEGEKKSNSSTVVISSAIWVI